MGSNLENMFNKAAESQDSEKEKRDKARMELIKRKIKEVYGIRESQKKLHDSIEETGTMTNEAEDVLSESNLDSEHLMKRPEVAEEIHEDALDEKRLRESLVSGALKFKNLNYPEVILEGEGTIKESKDDDFMRDSFGQAAEKERERIIGIYEEYKNNPDLIKTYVKSSYSREDLDRLESSEDEIVGYLKMVRPINDCKKIL